MGNQARVIKGRRCMWCSRYGFKGAHALVLHALTCKRLQKIGLYHADQNATIIQP